MQLQKIPEEAGFRGQRLPSETLQASFCCVPLLGMRALGEHGESIPVQLDGLFDVLQCLGFEAVEDHVGMFQDWAGVPPGSRNVVILSALSQGSLIRRHSFLGVSPSRAAGITSFSIRVGELHRV